MSKDIYAPLIRSVIAPAWAWWESSPYLSDYRDLKQTQYLPTEKIKELQWHKIADILDHAYARSDFYRQRLNVLGLKPSAIRNLEDFRHIGILTKQDLRQCFEQIAVADLHDQHVFLKTTSGSTGQKVKVLLDESSGQFKRACTLRADEWSGWRLGEKVAAIWGNPEYKKTWRGYIRNFLLERRQYLDTLDMDAYAIEQFARRMMQWQPSLIFGHAHSVYLFAQYVEQMQIKSIRPNGIITTAMVLHEHERVLIERVFECRVTNRYGCEEVSLIACECEQHQGLHINAESVYVEVMQDDKPAPLGEPGKIVVTDLTNRAMPIIRYEVGDIGVINSRLCECGRGLPLLEKLEGRAADYVYTPEGKLISGISLTENFASLLENVGQIQLIQDARDHLLIKIVDEGLDEKDMLAIQQLIQERFGSSMHYTLEKVAQIPREPSGKYRFCKSLIDNPLVTNYAER
jgi:phenylacetate-CoA ligase